MKTNLSLLTLVSVFSVVGLAETVTTTTAPVPAESELFGFFELRPSWITKMGEEHTENTIEAGYRVGDVKVSYLQWFNTNIYNPTPGEAQGAGTGNGLGLIASQGLFRVKVANVLQSEDKKTSLNYQARAYLPTYSGDYDDGLITQVRNYLTVKHDISSLLNVDASLVPIFHGYARAGTVLAGKPKANAVYENMVILEATLNFTEKLSLAIPVILEQTRYRDFVAGAKNNDAWAYSAVLWPELAYAVTPAQSVGVSFYTGNLADGVESGFHDMVAQAFWNVTL